VVAFLVTCDPQGDSPGYLSHRIVAGAVDGSLGALRRLHLMAGGTLRRHGLGVHGGGFSWSAGIPGQTVAASSCYGPHSGAVTTTVGQTHHRCSDDAVGCRAPIALRKSERINAEIPWQPTNQAPAREPLTNITCSCSGPPQGLSSPAVR